MKQIVSIFSLFIYTAVFGQLEEEKELYKELVKNPEYTWIYQTRIYLESPKELSLFFEKLNNEALKGNIEITDLNNQNLQKKSFQEKLSKIDTSFLMDPITLEIYTIYKTFKEINTSRIWLNEVWFFNETTKKIESKINYFSLIYDVYNLENKYKGAESLVRKRNFDIDSTQGLEEITIKRIIKMDSVGYNQFPIKILFEESINDKLINNIDYLKIIDEDGNLIKDNQSAIYSKEIDEVYGETSIKLSPLGIIYLEVEETWFIDYENFNIEKKINKVTPVTRFFPDLEGDLQQKSFSILFD